MEFPFQFNVFYFSIKGKNERLLNYKHLVLVPTCSYMPKAQSLPTTEVVTVNGNWIMYFFEHSFIVFVEDQHVTYLMMMPGLLNYRNQVSPLHSK